MKILKRVVIFQLVITRSVLDQMNVFKVTNNDINSKPFIVKLE